MFLFAVIFLLWWHYIEERRIQLKVWILNYLPASSYVVIRLKKRRGTLRKVKMALETPNIFRKKR